MVAIKTQHPESNDPEEIPGVHVLTAEEGHAYFDRRAKELIGMSGEEFLRRWDAGEFGPVPDTAESRGLQRLVMLLPFAGRSYS